MNDQLPRDHAEIDVLLDDALTKLEADHPTAFGALDLVWTRLAVHIRAEHLHLFPAVLEVSQRELTSEIPETLERLRRDHDFFMHEFVASIKALRIKAGTSRDAAEVLRAIRERLVEHNSIEEERIYPLVSARDDIELTRSITRELENLPPRLSERR